MTKWKMSMNKIVVALVFLAGGNAAFALNAPDTPLVTGPNFQQTPAAQIMVTPTGGAQTTLGAALASGGGVTVPTTTLVKTTSPSTFSQVTAIDAIPIGSTTPSTVAATSIASSLGITDTSTAGISTTGANGYLITGNPVINLLANQASPILSPETQNIPDPGANYLPNPNVIGYARTLTSASVNTYASMRTDNLTITGTVATHWGEIETTINLLGTGTMSGELNDWKSLVQIPSGLTVVAGENAELLMSNAGTVSTSWAGLTINPQNGATGTIAKVYGVKVVPINANSTANSMAALTAFDCGAVTGAGIVAAGQDVCLFNEDQNAVITNSGHYGARPGSAQPVLTGCGTSPTLDSRAGDVTGTITEGTTATGCTLTFHVAYAFVAPHCTVTSPNGAQYTAYTPSETALVITNISSSGSQFTYSCFAGF